METILGLAFLAISLPVNLPFRHPFPPRVEPSYSFPSLSIAQSNESHQVDQYLVPNLEPLDPHVFSRLDELDRPTLSIDIPNTDDGRRFQEIIQYANTHNLPAASMGEIMQAVAEQFLGAQYQAGLLDRSPQETLVISLQNFDCVLFVETVLALARNIALQDYQYQTFTHHLIDQRYRNGHLNGYCSRLHYFSDWISDNQRRGTVHNITFSLGGVSLKKKLNFMSTHQSHYDRLANHNANYQCIVEMEAHLERITIDYIPTQQIRSLDSSLQPGDIIGIATNIPGLDVTHTGLVYRTAKGQIGLIHASPKGKVTVSQDLLRYVNNVKDSIGILVARPLDPRQINTVNP